MTTDAADQTDVEAILHGVHQAIIQALAAISQQQREILAAINQQQTLAERVTVLRADMTAGVQKQEKALAEQKKTPPNCVIWLPTLQLELIAWRREPGGIRRFYRDIGR